MPGFDGTGPQGRGSMTGRGMGFCVLQESKDKPGQIEGLVGIQGTPIGNMNDDLRERKGVINMPRGDGTGPAGFGPMTGRAAGFCAGYQVPGYINPVAGRAGFYGPFAPVIGPYRTGFYGYGKGLVLAEFGRGQGRGRGRFGFRW